ncbi:MAG: hypothetical protein HOY69_25870, partial [Streptomyces sp.]|nr:hypothetical protein [Streptomyces sp.]
MTPPAPGTGRPGAVVDEIAALGPFFAFTTRPSPAPAGEPDWQPLDGPAV